MTQSIFLLLELEEGYRENAYYCSERYPTGGIGTKLGPRNASLSNYTFTISKSVAYAFLEEEVSNLRQSLNSEFEWFSGLNQARKDIIISMCYQLGFSGFCDFKRTIKFIADDNFTAAAIEMLDSTWNSQTPERAGRHSMVFDLGSYTSVSYYDNIN